MVVLNIHLEGIEQERFKDGNVTGIFEEILKRKIPVAISLPPHMKNYWIKKNSKIIDLVKEILSREENILGQQGLNHQCKHKHVFADKWHENFCLWHSKGIGAEEQKRFMEEGLGRLTRLVGKKPELYVPPNHQFDYSTLIAANCMGYKFFSDQAVIPIRAHEFQQFAVFGKMLIVPEGNLFRSEIEGRNAVYIHYDQIDSLREKYGEAVYDVIIDSATSMRSLKPQEVSERDKRKNRYSKYFRKYARDIKGSPKRFLRYLKSG